MSCWWLFLGLHTVYSSVLFPNKTGDCLQFSVCATLKLTAEVKFLIFAFFITSTWENKQANLYQHWFLCCLFWMELCSQNMHHWPMTQGVLSLFLFPLLQLHVWLSRQVTDGTTVRWGAACFAHKLLARDVCQEMSHWRQGLWLAGVYRLCTHTHGPLSMLLLCQQDHYPCTSNTTHPSSPGAN